MPSASGDASGLIDEWTPAALRTSGRGEEPFEDVADSRPSRVWLPSVLVVLIGLVLTGVGWGTTDSIVRGKHDETFDADAQAARDAVERRVAIYEEALRALRGLFVVDPDVDRAEFQQFVRTEDTIGRFPGIQALEFTRRVPHAELGDFETWVRTDTTLIDAGYPGFAVYPESDLEEHFVVDFIEPMEGNEQAFGFDLASNPERLQALEQARDSGDAVATAPVRLVQETDAQAGFLVLLPVYDGDSIPTTVEERRSSLIGFVNSVFRAEDMLSGVQVGDREMDLEIYDVGALDDTSSGPTQEGLLFSTVGHGASLDDSLPDRTTRLELAVDGRRWLLVVSDPASTRLRNLALVAVGLSGVALSVALGFVMFTVMRARRQAEAAVVQLAHHAMHDALTGLPNRMVLMDRVDRALARSARHGGIVAVMFLDLDRFKEINDHHGHEVGDQVLRAVARALERSIRADDTASRLGGDEFIILAQDLASAEEAQLLSQRVHRAIQDVGDAAPGVPLIVSLGFAISRDGDLDAGSLVARADAAMYVAKRGGRDRVVGFEPGMESELGTPPDW